MEKIIAENHKRYLERTGLYKNFGYDTEKERIFIIEKAQPLYGNVLEIGTGKGYFTIALAKEGYNFTSIDLSDAEQEFARSNIKYFALENQVDFKIGDAEHLKFDDRSFDIIFSVNMVHHLTNPFKVIDELIRVVSFEGKIIVSDFTEEGLAVVNKIHESEGRKHRVEQIDLTEISKYLLEKEFRIEKYKSTFQEIVIAYHPFI